jgi:hypothetical protein
MHGDEYNQGIFCNLWEYLDIMIMFARGENGRKDSIRK